MWDVLSVDSFVRMTFCLGYLLTVGCLSLGRYGEGRYVGASLKDHFDILIYLVIGIVTNDPDSWPYLRCCLPFLG